MSASRIRVNEAAGPFVPGAQIKTGIFSQKDKARQAMENFGKMLTQFNKDLKV
jgi:hypothetical protein